MVKYTIHMKATTENVSEISTPSDFVWSLKLECSNCHEKNDTWHTLTQTETFPQRVGSGVVHYFSKCKFCKKENSIVIPDKTIYSYKSESDGSFSPVVTFDCRGVAVCGFDFGDGWTVTTTKGTVFTNIDFSDFEWVEWNDTEGAVSILELEYKITSSK